MESGYHCFVVQSMILGSYLSWQIEKHINAIKEVTIDIAVNYVII